MAKNQNSGAMRQWVSHWALIKEFTYFQMKARYRRTWAGFVWVILSPLIMYLAQAIVFKNILKIGVPNYTVFLLGGLLPWIFIKTSFEMGIPVLQFSNELLHAFKIPPAVLVFSSILDNWINFLAAFFFILLPMIFFSHVQWGGFFLLPLAIIPLLIGTAALTWILSIINVFYRDTRFVVNFIMSILFFLTPIFYPKQYIPDNYQWLTHFNFILILIEPIQNSVYTFDFTVFAVNFSKSAGVMFLLVVLSFLYWKKIKNEFYHYLR